MQSFSNFNNLHHHSVQDNFQNILFGCEEWKGGSLYFAEKVLKLFKILFRKTTSTEALEISQQ